MDVNNPLFVISYKDSVLDDKKEQVKNKKNNNKKNSKIEIKNGVKFYHQKK